MIGWLSMAMAVEMPLWSVGRTPVVNLVYDDLDHPALAVGSEVVYRRPPSCRTSKSCVEVGRLVAERWPEAQRSPWAEANLRPHCEDGIVDACLAEHGVGGDEAAYTCVEDPASCGAWVADHVDDPHASTLLERSCGAADGEACVARAESEVGAVQLEWLDKACELGVSCDDRDLLRETLERERLHGLCVGGDGERCLALADRLEDDVFERRGSADYVLEACVQGSPVGCRRFDLDTARLGLDHPEVLSVLETLDQRCIGEEPGACRVAASLLRRTRPRDERYGDALVLLGAACRLGDGRACMDGGEYRRIGKARRSGQPPMELWSTGCEHAHGPSCAKLGTVQYERRSTREQGLATLQRGCEEGSANACGSLGVIHRRKRPEEAQRLFTTACDGGDGMACRELGLAGLKSTRGRLTPAHDAYPPFARGCDARDAVACLKGAKAHKTQSTAWDEEQRYQMTERGCSAGGLDGVEACRAQAKLLKLGKGVERDRSQGRALARAYAKRRPARLFRFTVGVGVPAVVAVGAEVKVPVRSLLSLTVAGEVGGASMNPDGLIGDVVGAAGVSSASLVGRLYPGRNASGLYVAGGMAIGKAWAEGIDVSKNEPISLAGPTARFGLNVQRSLFGMNLEVGAILAVIDDAIPLVPVAALRFGVAPR